MELVAYGIRAFSQKNYNDEERVCHEMAYHCRIFAVENKRIFDMETASKTQGRRKLDLLSAVENIVELAKDSQLSPEFYCNAKRFIKHLSDTLSLTKSRA